MEFNKENTKDRLFADILLPLPLPRPFTYHIPDTEREKVNIGSRVIVQFGKKRILTGIIVKVHSIEPDVYEAKDIIEILDDTPSVNAFQLKLFEWMAEYYMCHPGEVLNAALPSGLKVSSESKIQLNPNFEDLEEKIPFADKELLIIEMLEKKEALTFDEVSLIVGKKSGSSLIKSLIKKNRIIVFEEVKEKFTPKIIKKVRLCPPYNQKENMQELFTKLEKKPKQTDLLLKYIKLTGFLENPDKNSNGINKSQLIEESSLSPFTSLVKAGIFEEYEVVVSRFEEDSEESTFTEVRLSETQQNAKDSILEQFGEKEAVLLHGITGSGKTEIYIELIKNVLSGGSQVLYLLPEIALTTQIVQRLRKIFGDKMGIYHSKFSDNERVETWRGIISGRFSFVVGVRSSIFLPFDNLGLIIIDEEHETSYKQHDPAPRYHARDTALMLARMHHSKTLLGSATPSVESYFQAMNKKWGLVEITQRFGNAKLPQLIAVDVRKEKRDRKLHGDFTSLLTQQIEKSLHERNQVILFQNRRGYAPYISCEDCGHIPKCDNCAVSLTYHLYHKELRCHYCGSHESIPTRCEACGSNKIKTVGLGTEKIEDDIKLLFPEATTQRMDLDATRKKNSYQKIIEDFQNNKIDILVGTQMVTKGLDFDRVNLVGILDADSLIHFPDFRAHEKAFQTFTQVSGRAGRREKAGTVILQTSSINHPVIGKLLQQDYSGFFNTEISEREKFHYPPFYRLISITFKDPDATIASKGADRLFGKLKYFIPKEQILGPEPPLINKIRNYYLEEIILKFERNKANLPAIKFKIKEAIDKVLAETAFKNSIIVCDVDPV